MLNYAICPVVKLKVGSAIVTDGSNRCINTVNPN